MSIPLSKIGTSSAKLLKKIVRLAGPEPATLDPRFSFGDPDIENPLPRNQRPAERSFRAQDQSVTQTNQQTNQQTTASQDQKDTDDIPEIIRLLFKNSKQDEEQGEYYND